METRFERQIKKGALEMIVLGLIRQKPRYGYELILQLRRRSAGQLDLKEGTLYPILYRLEDDGQVVSAWAQTAQAPPAGRSPTPKKTYTITEKGISTLSREQAAWRQFTDCVEQIMKEEAE